MLIDGPPNCAVRRIGLAHTQFADATCGTIRLKLFKIGALVKVSVRRIKFALPSACPYADEWRLAAACLTRAAPAWKRVGRGLEEGWRGWNRLEEGWKRIGRGLAEDWKRVGRGLEEGWKRVGNSFVGLVSGRGDEPLAEGGPMVSTAIRLAFNRRSIAAAKAFLVTPSASG